MEVHNFLEYMNAATVQAARSLEELGIRLQQASRIIITDETLYALASAGQLGWSVGVKWRRDHLRMVSYGERHRVRPPRRQKRRARKRRGKR